MKKILLFLSFLLMSIGVWGATETELALGTFNGKNEIYTTGWTTNGTGKGRTDCITIGRGENITSPLVDLTTYDSIKISIKARRFGTLSGSKATITATFNSVVIGSSDATTTNATTSINDIKYTTNPNTATSSHFIFTCSNATSAGSTHGAGINSIIIVGYKGGSAPTTYTVSYDANGGSGTMTDSNSPYAAGATVTVLDNGFTAPSGKQFDKWNTADNGSGADYNPGRTFTINANTTLYAQWKDKPITDGIKFILLSDIDDLEDGDSIIIVNGHSIAMSTVQNSNNRGATKNFSYNSHNNIITIANNNTDVQIITVNQIDNNWELEVDGLYLYASSNSSNQLKTASKVAAGNNGKWRITIDEECIASVIAQGTNSHNVMQYNPNNGSPIFSCYSSASQESIKIYKKIKDLYTVVFKNNGVAIDTIYTIKHLSTIPSVSSNTLRCQKSGVFVGWSAHDIITTDTVPDDLFQTIKGSPIIESDKTFYAVFADETPRQSHPNNFILTIDKNDFTGGHGYNSCNGEKISIATSTDGKDTVHIVWTSDKIYKNADAMQWKADSGMIYNNTSLGVITSFSLIEKEDNQGTYTINFGSTEQPTGNPIVGNSYFKTTIGDKYGLTKSITINFTKDVTPKIYSNYTTYCIDTLQSGGNWSESGKWKHGRIPEFNEAAVLLDSAIVNIPHAVAKYVIMDKSSTNTGKLTIQPNKGLEIQDTISVYDGTYHTTTPNDLILKSSEAGNASLIFNNSNGDSATVNLYSKATYPGLDGSNADWQYIGTTMTELNALYNYYGSWLYKWVGGTEKWQAVPNGGMMEAWNGYCITQNEIACHETSGQLVPTTTKTLDIYAPHTVVANSWTAPIHIGAFRDEDFNNISDKRIYLFNTGFDPGGDGAVYETRHNSPGTYVVIPIHAAPYLDKDSLIPSQQGFFVKTNTNGYLILDYDRIVRTGGSGDIVAGPLRAPRRAAADDKPNVLKIYANGSRFSDRLTILEREDFTTSLDNGWDGDKMGFSNLAPSIYVINEDGSYDEVSAIPDYEGTLIGFKAGTDIAYSITFDYDGDETIYLNDMLTQTSTLIDNESKYVFTSDGSEEVRFVISATPYAGVATDIDKLTEQSNTTHKFLYNGNLYILKNNCIFNVVGSLIK